MIQFQYDEKKKRHNALVLQNLVVASITEDDRIIMHGELNIDLVRQILMGWDELSHQLEMKEKREAGEHDELLNNKQKGE